VYVGRVGALLNDHNRINDRNKDQTDGRTLNRYLTLSAVGAVSLGIIIIIIIIMLCNTEKYKNQAGMNLTPPPPSQNSHAVRWHCIAESERRVDEIKS